MSVLASKPYHRAVHHVSRWSSWYTRTIDTEVATARRDELASDLYEQAISADESGTSPRKVARTILSRAARGAGADLTWRYAQRRHAALANPASFRLRRVEGTVSALVLVAASSVAGAGIFVIIRIALSTIGGEIRPASETALTIVAFTALAIGALALLLRHRTRVSGAILMVLASIGVVHFGLFQLYSLSATVGAMTFTMPGWDLASTTFIAGLALFFTSAAVWWWPENGTDIVEAKSPLTTTEEMAP